MNPWTALIRPAFELLGKVFALVGPYLMGRSAGKTKERERTEHAHRERLEDLGQRQAERDDDQAKAPDHDRTEGTKWARDKKR